MTTHVNNPSLSAFQYVCEYLKPERQSQLDIRSMCTSACNAARPAAVPMRPQLLSAGRLQLRRAAHQLLPYLVCLLHS